MKWLARVTAITITATSFPALSQPIDASSTSAPQPVVATGTADEPHYITDVAGKRVRLVGPRFYTDTANAMQFPGRRNGAVKKRGAACGGKP
jgi:hypothetical protein